MSSPNVLSGSFKQGELVPPNLHSPRSNGSSTPSMPHYLQNERNVTSNFSYSFINTDFIDDSDPSLDPASISAFRNLTSTPRPSSHPLSLPKSLPIDWNLFNKQFTLNQKLRQSRLKRKRSFEEPEIKNNFENLPYQVIDFIADCVETQTDLINLSQTCKFFNKIINKRLYSKIIIVDNIISKYKNYDSDYTLLDAKNYPKLLATLHSNDTILQLITEIIIDTSSNNISYDQLNTNIYEPLYELFLTSNNNLRKLENMDLNNLKKFDSLLQFNRGHLIKHNHNKYNYYCSTAESLDEIIRKDLLNLKNFQLLDLNDINKLPSSTLKLSILIENKHNFKDQFNLNLNGFRVLSNITSLQLNTPTTFNLFVNELYTLYTREDSKLERLSNVKTLSISNIHKYGDDVPNELSFSKLNTIIDLSKVEELELKAKCYENILCNCCIMKFFDEWYTTLLSNEQSSLKALSIINQSPSSNANINMQWDQILTNKLFLEKFGANLEFFFISLNDFPFIPLFEKTQAFETNDNMTLPINEEILKIRKLMYKSLLDGFKNVQNVVIPDFFYNWLVYNNIEDLSNDENLNYLNYLDSCHCSSCCEARMIFKNYSKSTPFKDFKGRFNSNLNYGRSSNGITTSTYNKLNDSPDSYRIFYNYLIREMKNRIPLKQLNKVQSSLTHEKFPPNQINNAIVSDSDFNKLIKLMIHSLRPEISRILKSLPKIRKFNLGGILFKCYLRENNEITVHAVHDDYNEKFKL